MAQGGGGPTPQGPDPYWSNVVSLLHLDGAEGSTSFQDVNGNTWSAVGDAKISTIRGVSGGASLMLAPSGDSYISSNMTMPTFLGPFTFELFAYAPAGLIAPFALAFVVSGNGFILTANADGKLVVGARSVNENIVTASVPLPRDTFVHIAVARDSNGYLRIFQNGQLVGSVVYSSVFNGANTQLGAFTSLSQYFRGGFIDEFRVTLDVARYISDFTVPNVPFPDY